MKNRGKIFEDNFKKSIPKGLLYERFKDTGSSYYGGNDYLRFSQSNVCDCFLFDGSILYYLELKSHKGKSIPLSCIRENQIKELDKRQNSCSNVLSGFLIEFQDLERVFYLNIEEFKDFVLNNERKSIPFEYIRDVGIEVEVKKLRTNYRYNVSKMIDDIVNYNF